MGQILVDGGGGSIKKEYDGSERSRNDNNQRRTRNKTIKFNNIIQNRFS